MTLVFPIFSNGYYKCAGNEYGDIDEMYEELVKTNDFALVQDFLNKIEECQNQFNKSIQDTCKFVLYEDETPITEDDGRKDLFLTKSLYSLKVEIPDHILDKNTVVKAFEDVFNNGFYSREEIAVKSSIYKDLRYSLTVKIYVNDSADLNNYKETDYDYK